MNAVKLLRARARVTQARLAELGGTSQPAIAAYEAGRKTPTLRTLERLAKAVGLTLAVDYLAPLTREDRRSLALHAAVAERLGTAPGEVIARARRNLTLLRRMHPHARPLLREWAVLLDLPPSHLIDVLCDPRPHARELRQVSPFAGALGPSERADVYRRFAAGESEAA